MKALVEQAGPNARAGSAEEEVAASEVLLMATPWPATRAVVEGLGPLAGKILIDATDPILPRLAGKEFANTTSGAEQVAGWKAGARVVKAFNTVGFNVMAEPDFGGEASTLFYRGDDAEAKQVAKQQATELGFSAEDGGPLTRVRVLEPFAL